MTASPIRMPLSTAHNRKRRVSVRTLQEKGTNNNNKPLVLKQSSSNSLDSNSTAATSKIDFLKETRDFEDVFRSHAWLMAAATASSSSGVVGDEQDDDEDCDAWVLKRANPVMEEGEEDELQQYQSPTKRSRSFKLSASSPSNQQVVDWDDRISDEEPFLLTVESLGLVSHS
jgi:hypothetical protein